MAVQYILLLTSNFLYEGIVMVLRAKVKIYAVKSKRTINLPLKLVDDSAFPFTAGEDLVARIDDERLIIERMDRVK